MTPVTSLQLGEPMKRDRQNIERSGNPAARKYRNIGDITPEIVRSVFQKHHSFEEHFNKPGFNFSHLPKEQQLQYNDHYTELNDILRHSLSPEKYEDMLMEKIGKRRLTTKQMYQILSNAVNQIETGRV